MFFKRKPKEPQGGQVLLFVCLRSPGPIVWPDVEGATRDVGTDGRAYDMSAATYDFADGRVIAGHMPVPIPGGEVEGQVPFSRFWDASASTDHQSNVVLMGHGDNALTAMEYAANVAAAITAVNDTVAWYVGNASHIVSPEMASDLATSSARMAIFVNVIHSANPGGGLDASTLGMESFRREFEVIGAHKTGEDLFGMLLDLAAYVLDRGPVLKHGQTFGASADERFGIEIGRSRLGKPGKVIRLLVP